MSDELGRALADPVQHKRDERETAPPVLARIDEVTHLGADFVGWLVANQVAGALENPPLAQGFDLRLHLFNAPTETRGESGGVERNLRIAVEEHNDVPRQKRPDVALYELCDRGPEDPF